MKKPHMMHAATAMLFAVAVQGCGIPLIERPRTSAGQEVRSMIGKAGSDRPIRLGVTTRSEIAKQLGEPRWRTRCEVAVGYEYTARAIFWFDLLVRTEEVVFPFHPPYTPAYYFLFLNFDDAGVLQRFSLQRKEGFGQAEADDEWKTFVAPIGDEDSATTRAAPYFDRGR